MDRTQGGILVSGGRTHLRYPCKIGWERCQRSEANEGVAIDGWQSGDVSRSIRRSKAATNGVLSRAQVCTGAVEKPTVGHRGRHYSRKTVAGQWSVQQLDIPSYDRQTMQECYLWRRLAWQDADVGSWKFVI